VKTTSFNPIQPLELSPTTMQHLLTQPSLYNILADACASGWLWLGLERYDGFLIASAGDASLRDTGSASAQHQFWSGEHLFATLQGYGDGAVLADFVRLIGQRIEAYLASEATILSLSQANVAATTALQQLSHLAPILHSNNVTQIGSAVVQWIAETLGALQARIVLHSADNEYTLASYCGEAPSGIVGPHAKAHAKLTASGKLIGELVLEGCLVESQFSAADLLVLNTVASFAANAILQAQQGEQQQLHYERARYEIALAGTNIDNLMQQSAETLANTFQFEQVECWLFEGDLAYLKGYVGPSNAAEFDSPRQSCSLLADRNRLAFVRETQGESETARMRIPLACSGAVVGVLQIQDPHSRSSSDLLHVESVAAQISYSLSHLRRLEETKQADEHAKIMAIGTLATGVSHEFNNVLTSIQGFAELGLRGTPAQKDEALQVVLRGTKRGVEITRGLLMFARPNKGQHLNIELATIADEALALLRKSLEQQSIQVVCDYQARGTVLGDPNQLRQALMNLLSNALKFTQEGYVAINVCRRSSLDDSERLVFSVSDSGIGIPREAQLHLFESFAQGDSSTTRRYGGSGLGLAISKELVEMMKGCIEVHSTLGQGTRFTFDIPLDAREAEEDELVRLLRGQSALLCSLDGLGLDALERLLARWGMRTARCQNPERLLECFDDFPSPPLLVLMAPWPGSAEHWLDTLLPRLQLDQRILLLCPPDQGMSLPAQRSLRAQGLTLPLSLRPLRETLMELYVERRRTPRPAQPDSLGEGVEAPCILVAEDNLVNQMVVQGFLRKRGYQVRLVNNGRAALEEYRRAPEAIRLILMDCEMPEMDGFEATRQIRQLERERQLSPVPVIALTAHIFDEHRQQGMEAGMDDFLGKPLDGELLYATLDQHLARQPLES